MKPENAVLNKKEIRFLDINGGLEARNEGNVERIA